MKISLQYQRQIEATDKRIDDLVFELYGVSEEEKSLIFQK